MGIFNSMNEGIVHYGNRSDICELSARELAVEKKIDLMTARNSLRGSLEGKKVVKFRQSGADIVLSLDTIRRIAKENPAPEAEEVVDEDK